MDVLQLNAMDREVERQQDRILNLYNPQAMTFTEALEVMGVIKPKYETLEFDDEEDYEEALAWYQNKEEVEIIYNDFDGETGTIEIKK